MSPNATGVCKPSAGGHGGVCAECAQGALPAQARDGHQLSLVQTTALVRDTLLGLRSRSSYCSAFHLGVGPETSLLC